LMPNVLLLFVNVALLLFSMSGKFWSELIVTTSFGLTGVLKSPKTDIGANNTQTSVNVIRVGLTIHPPHEYN
jgi:hypothetical protein